MSTITSIYAREILDSRGNPTVEATVCLDNGVFGTAAVPSGASTGTHEALELRDGDTSRYHGLGVLKACAHIHDRIAPALKGKEITKQEDIDQTMIDLDGTENKSNLGANAILAVSLATCRAAAQAKQIPLYAYISSLGFPRSNTTADVTPMLNVLNGGVHAGWNIDFQECMVVPKRSYSFQDSIRVGVEIYHVLKTLMKKKGFQVAVGDEGGFAPALGTNKDALSFLKEAIFSAGYEYGNDVSIGLDLASSEFFKDGKYTIKDVPYPQETKAFIMELLQLQKEFGICSLEDPLSEDDWEGWTELTNQIEKISSTIPSTGMPVRIVGDDLLVTNKKRLEMAIEKKACNSILIKVNQIGSLSETLAVIKRAREAGFSIIVSHRSGETTDDFISDLAVGVSAEYVKFGAPARGERVAKFNRLLSIYASLKK